MDGRKTDLQRLKSNYTNSGIGEHCVGQQDNGILMKLIFEKFKTSEFWLMFLSSSAVVYAMWKSTASLDRCAIALTILIASYMISRSLYKQMRAQVTGIFTSEFHFLVTGIGAFAYFAWKQLLAIDLALLLSCILLGVYFISRGLAKRITQRQIPFL